MATSISIAMLTAAALGSRGGPRKRGMYSEDGVTLLTITYSYLSMAASTQLRLVALFYFCLAVSSASSVRGRRHLVRIKRFSIHKRVFETGQVSEM